MSDDQRAKIVKAQELEQEMAKLVDIFPRVWKGLYQRLMDEGFKEPQAMELLKAYIVGSSGGGKV
jgi:hypothetical protein